MTGTWHPLSYAQQAMWHVHQLAAGSSPYHINLATTVARGLDVAALRRVVQALTDRHPALRTTIAERDGEPGQYVHPTLTADVDVVPGAADEAAVQAAADQPFDLTCDPPLRVRVFTGASPARLLFTFHHIAWDFESILVALDDLAELYRAEFTGRPAELTPPGAPYSEHVRWEAALLRSEIGAAGLEHWTRQLQAMPAATDLPTDRPRPAARTYVGGMWYTDLDPARTVAVDRLARTAGVTRYAVLLALFQLALARCSGRRDIVVGTAATQRIRAEVRRTIGNFVNPLSQWTRVDGASTVRQLLNEVSSSVYTGLRHCLVPFPAIVAHARPDYDPSRSPVFDVLFVYDRPRDRDRDAVTAFVAGHGEIDLGGLVLRSTPLECTGTMYDLTAYVFDGTDRLSVRWEYRRELFDEARVAAFAEHFDALLAAAAEAPDTPLADLDGMPSDQRRTVTGFATGPVRHRPDPLLLHALVEGQVDRTPQAVAVAFRDTVLTYAELDRRANQLARQLRSLGVGPEVVVPVCLERSLAIVVALLAVLKAGGAYLPLNPQDPPARRAGLAAAANAGVVVAAPGDRWHGDQQVIAVDDTWATLRDEPDDRPEVAVRAGNLAYVIFTSGSTGEPKGVLCTHAGVVNRLHWAQEEYRLDETDRVLQKTPFGFDVSVWEFFWPLGVGARLVVAEPGGHRDVAYLVDLIDTAGVTTVHFVPSMLQEFLTGPTRASLPTLRRVLCSGEELTRSQVRTATTVLGCPVHNLYGPTEASIDVTARPCPPDETGPVPIGRPVANTRVWVLDEDLRPAPVGVPGELYLAGVQVARGYLGRPDLTAERFLPDPRGPGRLYRTGDLGRWNSAGEIEYLGRTDHQVKIRGYRAEPAEIRRAVEEDPLVVEAVVDVRHHGGEARLVAYVVVEDRAAFTSSALRSGLRTRLPEYLVPAGVMAVDELPRGPHGKIDRARLPEPTTQAWVHREVYVAPRTPLEEQLAEAWAGLLGTAQIGVRDSFFDIGGHSLTATRMVTEIGDRFGVHLPVNAIFAAPTLEEFAMTVLQHLLDADGGDPAPTGDPAAGGPVDVLSVDPAERAALAALATRLAALPGQLETLITRPDFADACDSLPESLAAALDRFTGGSVSGVLVIGGLPVGSVPATPTSYAGDVLGRHPTSDLLALVAARLGGVIGYEDEKFGALIHDVYPVRRDAAEQVNSGSVRLDLHTENVHHPLRPEYVGLLCLRQDPADEAATLVASVHDAVPLLDADDLAVLSQPRFHHRFPHSFTRHRRGEPDVHARPVLEADPVRTWRLRFDSSNTVAADPVAARALEALRKAFRSVCREIKLRTGELIVVDNRLVVHGRTEFRPSYDGTDRWLRRFYAYAGAVPAEALCAPGGRVVSRRVYRSLP